MDDPIAHLKVVNDKKILLLVMDGLGGLPHVDSGLTELEAAKTPNFDELIKLSECGLHIPVGYGITPGSAPGHLALFGYDPLQYPIGRGIVAALGIGFPVKSGDVAVRLNFASRDSDGIIIDRRAGRISTDICTGLAQKLDKISVPDANVIVRAVRDYRAVVVFSGKNLSDKVADTDPQKTGVLPQLPIAMDSSSDHTAKIVERFIEEARSLLLDEFPANEILLRGFAQLPVIPSLEERFGLGGVAIAVYPDYKGVSRLVGMEVVENLSDLNDQVTALKECWNKHDYFFFHHKYTDSTGEDGDFDGKVSQIEKVDSILPEILNLDPDVVIITGDHSTPSTERSHSSHPVPFMINSSGCRPDSVKSFGERACSAGVWHVLPGKALMPIALGYAGKVARYGA